MKSLLSSALLVAPLLSFAAAEPIPSAVLIDSTPTLASASQAISRRSDNPNIEALDRYQNRWTCMMWSPPGADDPPPRQQCGDVCGAQVSQAVEEQGLGSYTCIGNGQWLDPISGKNLSDSDANNPNKNKIMGGKCKCNLPIIQELGEFFIEAVKLIGQLTCEVWMGAFEIVAEVGALAIPGVGEAIDAGMVAAIQAAKWFEYAYDAYDAANEFSSWAGKGLGLSQNVCGGSIISTSQIISSFVPLKGAPNSILPGGFKTPNFPKGSKSSPKNKPSVNAPKSNSPQQTGGPKSDSPKSSAAPKSSAEPSSQAASSASKAASSTHASTTNAASSSTSASASSSHHTSSQTGSATSHHTTSTATHESSTMTSKEPRSSGTAASSGFKLSHLSTMLPARPRRWDVDWKKEVKRY